MSRFVWELGEAIGYTPKGGGMEVKDLGAEIRIDLRYREALWIVRILKESNDEKALDLASKIGRALSGDMSSILGESVYKPEDRK